MTKKLKRGQKVKVIHNKHVYDFSPEDMAWECNLGWMPCRGWCAVYGEIVHSFRMTYNDVPGLFYVVKMQRNPDPTQLLVFRENFVHTIDSFPQPGEEEVVMPPKHD